MTMPTLSLPLAFALVAVAVAWTAAGCGVGTDLDAERSRYRCTTDAECEAGRACVEGWCVVGEIVEADTSLPTCPVGQVDCGGTCVETTTDADNCGACGFGCGDGESCIGGRCACGQILAAPTDEACVGASACCDGTCIDVLRDAANCGACDESCGSGLRCDAGMCICAVGLGACEDPDACETDLLSSTLHCGACGVACASMADCLGGQCSCGGDRCETDESCCPIGNNTVCADTDTSTTSCGACGNACRPGETCTGGSCACGGGAGCTGGDVCCNGTCAAPDSPACDCGGSPCGDTCCIDQCVDATTDRNNCGACGVSCGAAQMCVDGTCVCADGLSACGGSCVDVLDDPNHCGVCDNACAAGLCCNAACADPQTDDANCGGCGLACASDEDCVGGTCADASQIVQIAAGKSTTCARRSSGAVFCWGRGNDGELGNGTQNDSAVPVLAQLPEAAVWIDVEDNVGCAAGVSGEVWCWGKSPSGILGENNNENASVPVAVGLGSANRAVRVAVGYDHACAVLDDGTAMCWGSHEDGQMGVGESVPPTDNLPPIAVVDLAGIEAISLGERTSFARLADGSVWGWGDARNDKLGIDGICGQQLEVEEPCSLDVDNAVGIATARQAGIVIDVFGVLWGWGRNDDDFLFGGPEFEPDQLGPSNLLAIEAGRSHGCAIDGARTVSCWGRNLDDQLGHTKGRDFDAVQGLSGTFVDLGLGEDHSCALRDDGAVFCWGRGGQGQLGHGMSQSSSTPVRVTGS